MEDSNCGSEFHHEYFNKHICPNYYPLIKECKIHTKKKEANGNSIHNLVHFALWEA